MTDKSNTELLMEQMQAEVQGFSSVKNLAIRAGVSTTTVYRLRNGKTKWPRANTMDSVLHTMGYELQLRKIK